MEKAKSQNDWLDNYWRYADTLKELQQAIVDRDNCRSPDHPNHNKM